jgi:hypothetical protein
MGTRTLSRTETRSGSSFYGTRTDSRVTFVNDSRLV